MSKGGQKNRNVFEKPEKTSLKVKVKKLARKKARKTRKSGTRTKVEGKKKALRNAEKATLRPEEVALKRNKVNEFEGRILEEKIERSKELIMWSGVIFFMLLITFLWIYNIRHTFEASRLENDSESSIKGWQEMTRDLEERIGDFKEDYEKIKEIEIDEEKGGGGLPESLSSTSTLELSLATSTISNIEVTQEEIEELKKKLEAGQ